MVASTVGERRAHKLTDRNLARRHHPIERRCHICIAEIDFGLLLAGLRGLQVGLRGVTRRKRLVVIGLGRDLLLDQIGLALVLRFVLRQRRLRADDSRLRGIHFEFVRLRLDREQRRAFFHVIAVFVADGLDEALHPGHQIDRVDRRRIAGRIEIACDLLLDGRGHSNLWRRRRGVLIILAAGRESRCDGKNRHGTDTCDGSHARNLVKFSQSRIVAAINTGMGHYDPISDVVWQAERRSAP